MAGRSSTTAPPGSSRDAPADGCGGRGDGSGPERREEPVVLGEPHLGAAVVSLRVEVAVRAEVLAPRTVGGLEQVLRRVGRVGARPLLALVAGLGEIAVEQPGEQCV